MNNSITQYPEILIRILAGQGACLNLSRRENAATRNELSEKDTQRDKNFSHR